MLSTDPRPARADGCCRLRPRQDRRTWKLLDHVHVTVQFPGPTRTEGRLTEVRYGSKCLMPLELELDVWSTYAQASVSGEGSLDEFLDVLRVVAAMTSHSYPRLLLDLRRLHGLEKMTEQMTAGMEAARQLGHACRVAVIEPAARVTLNGEKAARRLGLDLRVFAAEDEPRAVLWLTEKNDSCGTAAG